MENTLSYQAVINSDGTVKILETILDDEGQIKNATYEPVRLEADSIGEMQELLRVIYRNLTKVKPITEEELDAILFGSVDIPLGEEEDKVINLIDYFANDSLLKRP